MKRQTHLKEHGQALVIIAIAGIALFAFAALAIDGSMVFSDRRHAQNAADTAALDAALAKVRGGLWQSEGLDRALSNGYSNDADSTVVVLLCTDASASCNNLPTGANPADFIQVKISSIVNTTFARIIGVAHITNKVDAVARATEPEFTKWFDGKALVSVMEGCKGDAGAPNNPFTVGGSSTTIVNNSGIFVNSSCNLALVDNGGSNLVTTDEGVCVVGGVQPGTNGISPAASPNCGSQIDPNMYKLPNPACGQAGSITGSGGDYDAWPGNFDLTGNKTFPDANPSGTLRLHKGIYCFHNGLSLNGNWEITSDVNGNGVHDADSEGVLFFVPDGDVTFNGGSTTTIHAISSTADNFPEQLLNYLIYIPPTNEANLTVTGNNGSEFTGTILAPASHITLNGSGNTFSMDAQIIGYDTTITGSGYIDITYNAGNNASTTTQPGLEMTK